MFDNDIHEKEKANDVIQSDHLVGQELLNMGDRSSLVVAFIWIIIATLLSIYDTFVRRLCDTVPVQYVYGLFNKAEQRMKEEMEKKFGKIEEKKNETNGYFDVLKEF